MSAKIQDLNEIVRICEQKKKYGDFQTLANVLNINVDTARMRYYRKNEQAIKLLYNIIEQRENLLEKFKIQQEIEEKKEF